jgi:hypothetical protein
MSKGLGANANQFTKEGVWMNRRDLVAEGFRYLAQVLPALAVTAGNLRMFLRQPVGAAIDQGAACFPSQPEEIVPTTLTTLTTLNEEK